MKNSSGESVGTPRSFNLVDEPWIPVVDAAGATFKVGLRELFERSEELVDLAVGTLERISLYRLLICVAQRALDGPKNEDDWLEAEGKLVPASLAYLEQQRDRFDLWGERPFLQVKELQADSESVTDRLDLGLAVGSNNTLFDQAALVEGRNHKSDWLARYLLVYLAFAPNHPISFASINGKILGEVKNGKVYPSSAPYVNTLFAFLLGKNLCQTIAWNLISVECLSFTRQLGKPAWEFDDFVESKIQTELKTTWTGNLVPVARFIRLIDNRKMILTGGVDYLGFPDIREPMAVVLRNKENWQILKTDSSRKPWQQLQAMLAWEKEGEGALSLKNIRRLVNKEVKDEFFKIWVGGLEKEGGTSAKIIDVASWSVEIPWEYFSNVEESAALKTYEIGVKVAQNAEKRLVGAIKRYCDSLSNEAQKKEGNKKTSLLIQAKNRFWTALERHVNELINEAAKKCLTQWLKILTIEMRDAYEKTCPRRTARQLQAFAEGNRILYLPEKKKKTASKASKGKEKKNNSTTDDDEK